MIFQFSSQVIISLICSCSCVPFLAKKNQRGFSHFLSLVIISKAQIPYSFSFGFTQGN
jgi:hypothetical protein